MVKAICSSSSACSFAGWERSEEAAAKLLPRDLHSVLRTGTSKPFCDLSALVASTWGALPSAGKLKHFQTKKEQQWNYYQHRTYYSQGCKSSQILSSGLKKTPSWDLSRRPV